MAAQAEDPTLDATRRSKPTGGFARHAELVVYKAWADLRAEAGRTYLGFAWWFVEPMIYLAVFWVIRDVVMGARSAHSVEWLLLGIVPFQWLRISVSNGGGSILGARSLIQRIALPKIVLPLSRTLANALKFCCLFALLLLFVWLRATPPTTACFALPIVLLVQLGFVTAAAVAAAAIVPLLPDLRLLIDHLLMALFWLSGVFFSVDALPEDVRGVFYLNPMACLIEDYRVILLQGDAPHLGRLSYVATLSAATLFGAILLLRRFERRYPKITA